MNREQKRIALRRRLSVAGIVATVMSAVLFHPIQVLMTPIIRLTVGSTWFDMGHRNWWGLLGDSVVLVFYGGATAVAVYYGKKAWRDICRSFARSQRVVWNWKPRPTIRRFAIAALAATALMYAGLHISSWAYGNAIRAMNPVHARVSVGCGPHVTHCGNERT